MIAIEYRRIDGCTNTERELVADDLDYRCFLGDVSLALDGMVIDARWGWVPIGHFATLLLIAVRDLLLGRSHAEVSFTENDEVICFDSEGRDVRVSATFTSVVGRCTLHELRNASVQFATRFFDDIIEQRPSLSSAKVVEERLRLVAEVSRLTP